MLGIPEVMLILGVLLLVFGPSKLPEMAKSLGSAMREFKKATSDLEQQAQLLEKSIGADPASGLQKATSSIEQQLDKSLATDPALEPKKVAQSIEPQVDNPVNKEPSIEINKSGSNLQALSNESKTKVKPAYDTNVIRVGGSPLVSTTVKRDSTLADVSKMLNICPDCKPDEELKEEIIEKIKSLNNTVEKGV